jgi:hypothetical protein
VIFDRLKRKYGYDIEARRMHEEVPQAPSRPTSPPRQLELVQPR